MQVGNGSDLTLPSAVTRYAVILFYFHYAGILRAAGKLAFCYEKNTINIGSNCYILSRVLQLYE